MKIFVDIFGVTTFWTILRSFFKVCNVQNRNIFGLC